MVDLEPRAEIHNDHRIIVAEKIGFVIIERLAPLRSRRESIVQSNMVVFLMRITHFLEFDGNGTVSVFPGRLSICFLCLLLLLVWEPADIQSFASSSAISVLLCGPKTPLLP